MVSPDKKISHTLHSTGCNLSYFLKSDFLVKFVVKGFVLSPLYRVSPVHQFAAELLFYCVPDPWQDLLCEPAFY